MSAAPGVEARPAAGGGFAAVWAQVRAWSEPERAAGAACAAAALALLAWAARLWPEWSRNPDLSHGFLAVPAVALLWFRAREDAPASRGLGPVAQTALVLAATLGLGGAALLAAVYATAFGWTAAPTLFLASAAMAAALTLAVLLAAGRAVRWIAPGWPALVLPAVVLLSAPLPPGTYSRLTLGLQSGITVGVVETLRLFGVAALRSGNVINLGTTSVGVEEACSGVRSLISCVLAGLVLSALLLRSPVRRVLLVGLAAPLALATNFARSLALTLLARGGVDITGFWHDALGYAVLLVTAGVLAALAFFLEEAPARTAPRTVAAPDQAWKPASVLALAALALAFGWVGQVLARTQFGVTAASTPPDLEQLVPARAEGWTVTTRTDLGRFAGILRTDHLLERSYAKAGADGRLLQLTVYTAWWPAGASSVSEVATHTPEACWPGTGWTLLPEGTVRRTLRLTDGRVADEAEQRSFVGNGYPQRVWFWHVVDGAPLGPFEPKSWRQQLRLFFERGIRRDEPQVFARLSSNREWAEIAGEPLVGEALAGLARLGVPLRVPAVAEVAAGPK